MTPEQLDDLFNSSLVKSTLDLHDNGTPVSQEDVREAIASIVKSIDLKKALIDTVRLEREREIYGDLFDKLTLPPRNSMDPQQQPISKKYPAVSDAQILTQIQRIKKDDIFGTQIGDLIVYLPFTMAKEFIKEGVTEATWEEMQKTQPATYDAAINQITEYMSFAWNKANGCRGLSAARSIDHFIAWTFLLGEEELSRKLKDVEYTHYGKPHLREICKHFKLDWTRWDNGHWTNHEGEDGVKPDEVPAPW
jgi:hypothetical protein